MEGEVLTKEFALHMILNSIRATFVKFKRDYGTMVICCDGKYNWRKGVFKYYKYKRKKDREKDNIDWDLIYECLEYAKEEIKDGFPYCVIEIDDAEADDIIGALALYATQIEENSIIISNDKDFTQRHSEFVNQYRPCDQGTYCNRQPQKYLKELIIRGDADDGIPNIKSPDNQFAEPNPKQKSIFQKDLDIWLADDNNEWLNGNEGLKKGFDRNSLLIDLNNTPEHIKEQSVSLYVSGKRTANKAQMTKFFIKNRLRMLHEKMNDFI